MATDVRYLHVSSEQELRATIENYTIQGFVVASREPGQVTLRKDKEFSVLWAVVGFVLCLLPFLIYLIVYASEKDVVVVVRIGSGMQLSSDGYYWHNGAQWVLLTANSVPPGTQMSPDRNNWWDGGNWRRFPGMDQLPPPTAGR